MSQHLQKKKQELKYAKEVNNRFHNDLQRVITYVIQKEWLDEYKSQIIRTNQEKAQFIKTETQRKIQEAKMYMSESKK